MSDYLNRQPKPGAKALATVLSVAAVCIYPPMLLAAPFLLFTRPSKSRR